MRQNIVLVALSALTAVSAQNQGQNFTIDKSLVEDGTKIDWCNAQYDSCNTLCFNAVSANDCINQSLEYTCECTNGTAPGLQYYIQTMPTKICEEAFKQCIAKNAGDSRAQGACKTDIQDNCGTLDPADAKANSEPAEDEGGDESAPTDNESDGAQNEDPSTSTSVGAAAPTNAYLGNGVAMVAAGVFAALL